MKNLFKILFCAFALTFLLQIASVFTQNKSSEKIPAMPRLLSLREQMNVR